MARVLRRRRPTVTEGPGPVVGLFVDASVKLTVSGATPEVGVPLNAAVGGGTGDVTLM